MKYIIVKHIFLILILINILEKETSSWAHLWPDARCINQKNAKLEYCFTREKELHSKKQGVPMGINDCVKMTVFFEFYIEIQDDRPKMVGKRFLGKVD